MIGVFFWIAPANPNAQVQAQDRDQAAPPSTADIQSVISSRCVGCHAIHPKLMDAPAPKGVILESAEDIDKHANMIFIQAVQLKVMPLGNITHITDEERALIARWYAGRTP